MGGDSAGIPSVRLEGENITPDQIEASLRKWVDSIPFRLRKVLLLPPDFTRSHSAAGLIVRLLYDILSPGCQVDIMPALGTHAPVTDQERMAMFGPRIPAERFFVHRWREDVQKVGEIPADYVDQVSGGLFRESICVELNRRILDRSYDLIVSVGQVVPHEVVGMANYSKNVLVGCGGKDFIDKSHFVGAVFGMERIMGRDHSPVRKLFDYAEERFLRDIPLQYILTVTSAEPAAAVQARDVVSSDTIVSADTASPDPALVESRVHGVFIGRDRRLFEEAVRLSQRWNLTVLDKPLRKVVVFLDPNEFRSTWVGNKAIYRTRMAIADGGELLIIAPGVRQFGEDRAIDLLIRKYGYVGSARILAMVQREPDLRNNLSVAAHLIHGSSEGRFQITYAPGHLSRQEIEQVNFRFMPLASALAKYNLTVLREGFNTVENGEEIFFIRKPALGLWTVKENMA